MTGLAAVDYLPRPCRERCTRRPYSPVGLIWRRRVVHLAGDKPQRYVFCQRDLTSTHGSANLGWEKLPLKLTGASIPDRSLAPAFVPITG